MSASHEPDPARYDRSLPRKRMAAGVLLFDTAGRFLLVDPVYKDGWEMPGGTVEQDESPRDAACREVKEELGLVRTPGRLLCVDWVAARSGRSEGLVTVFDGGVLPEASVAEIRLQPEELRAHAFMDLTAAHRCLPPLLARRVAASLRARDLGGTSYLENGHPVC
ncbi:NUDIX domain-containing protein [Streptomyces sp. NPDC092296]|uniref:NUDIX domain-containing protein n=1 Tax=Streptomyces sp. NPDC092296 TaxID=3366012 RepID=UPI0037F5018F